MNTSSAWTLTYWPDPVLHEKCKEGKIPSGLILEMEEIVKQHNALGLACSQVGVTECRVFVMKDTNPDKPGDFLVFENPIIVERGRETYTEAEGCLSFPDQRVQVVRHRAIDIEFDVPAGYEYPVGDIRTTWHFEGLNARVIQHEIDHLDGIMIFDHINSNLVQKMTLEKYFKKRKKHARLV